MSRRLFNVAQPVSSLETGQISRARSRRITSGLARTWREAS